MKGFQRAIVQRRIGRDKEAIRKFNLQIMSNANALSAIVRAVCEHFQIPPSNLEARCRKWDDYVWPRFIAVALVKEHTTWSIAQIAAIFNQHSTTINNGLQHLKDYCETSRALRDEFNAIRLRLVGHLPDSSSAKLSPA